MLYENTFDSTSLDDFEVEESESDIGTHDVLAGKLELSVDPGLFAAFKKTYMLRYKYPVGTGEFSIDIDSHTFLDGNEYEVGLALVPTSSPLIYDPAKVDFVGVRSIGGVNKATARSVRYPDIESNETSSYSLPMTVKIVRSDKFIRMSIINGGIETVLLTTTDVPDGPSVICIMISADTSLAADATFDNVSLNWESPIGNMLWFYMPNWYQKYPIGISTSGDIQLTKNGVICILQDIADLLDTAENGLFLHPGIGPGLIKFLGLPDKESNTTRLINQVSSSLETEGVEPRLQDGKSTVTVEAITTESFKVSIEASAIDGDTVIPLNLVYEYGVDSLAKLWANPSYAPLTETPVGPDGYSYPSLGRDHYIDRDNPITDPSEEKELPQYKIIEAIGMEFDILLYSFIQMRNDFSIATSSEDGLVALGAKRNLIKKASESREEFRERISDELENKQDDGRLQGLDKLFAFYNFDSTSIEGFTVISADEWPRQYWAQVHVYLEANAPIEVTQSEFFLAVERRKRACRRVVFKEIKGGARTWNQGKWDNGPIIDHDVFLESFN